VPPWDLGPVDLQVQSILLLRISRNIIDILANDSHIHLDEIETATKKGL
jgi:hypothetical protein